VRYGRGTDADQAAPGTAARRADALGATLYEAALSGRPSLAWRAAFLRPPPTLLTREYTPEPGRMGLAWSSIHFRTTPTQLEGWLRRIDSWIAYANSVADE
jgi:hypothetical protein